MADKQETGKLLEGEVVPVVLRAEAVRMPEQQKPPAPPAPPTPPAAPVAKKADG
jgi:hypothetical protein